MQRYSDQQPQSFGGKGVHLATEATDLKWRRRTSAEAAVAPGEVPWTLDRGLEKTSSPTSARLRVSDDAMLAVHAPGGGRQAKEFYAAEKAVERSKAKLKAVESWWGLAKTNATVTVRDERHGRPRTLRRVVPTINQTAVRDSWQPVYTTCNAIATRVLGAMGRSEMAFQEGEHFNPSWEKTRAQTARDRHARPDVGQAFYAAAKETGSKRMANTWDQHWAGVLARSGADWVTVENFSRDAADGALRALHQSLVESFTARGTKALDVALGDSSTSDSATITTDVVKLLDQEAKNVGAQAPTEIKRVTTLMVEQNAKWYTAMYGSKPTQTFHDTWVSDTGAPGTVAAGTTATVKRADH